MDDKYIMENLMFGSKVINDLFMHGIIESANEDVSVVFMKAMQEAAKMHYDIFKAMETAGFYTINNVDESKIKKLKTKLECSCKECECEDCACEKEDN